MSVKKEKKYLLLRSVLPGNTRNHECTAGLCSYELNVSGYPEKWEHSVVWPSQAETRGPCARNWINHTCPVKTELKQDRDNKRVEEDLEPDRKGVELLYLFRSCYDC